MKKSLLIIGLIVLLTGCATQKHINPDRVTLPKDKYENDIKLLEKARKSESDEIKVHQKNVAEYNREIKHLKKIIKFVK